MARADFDYAAQYCEENVARLLDRADLPRPRTAVFIASAGEHVALWHQRAAQAPGQPVLWDYHVVLLTLAHVPQLWDLDSTLPWPCDAARYLRETFAAVDIDPALRPRFRLLPERLFRAVFASDRSHMRREDGTWLAPPPPWPCIQAPGESMTLPALRDVCAPGPGERLDLDAFVARASGR